VRSAACAFVSSGARGASPGGEEREYGEPGDHRPQHTKTGTVYESNVWLRRAACHIHDVRFLLVLALILGPACGSSATPSEPDRLDLNHATEKQLEALPGIGPKHARSIMAARNARGGQFKRLEDLLSINGIGPKTIEELRPYVELR
jgi:competence ComEA-like helix-hairpin-helix protein